MNTEHCDLTFLHIYCLELVSRVSLQYKGDQNERGAVPIKVKTLVLQNLAFGFIAALCSCDQNVRGGARFPLKWIISSGERGGSKIRRWEVHRQLPTQALCR